MTKQNSSEMKNKRPEILSAKVNNSMNEIEKFQNATIRPVIKMLHPILIVAFRSYITNKKIAFHDFSEEKRIEFIGTIFQKDIAFKNELKGMVLGNFSLEEFKSYQEISKESNKRILSMIKERICNSMPELLQK